MDYTLWTTIWTTSKVQNFAVKPLTCGFWRPLPSERVECDPVQSKPSQTTLTEAYVEMSVNSTHSVWFFARNLRRFGLRLRPPIVPVGVVAYFLQEYERKWNSRARVFLFWFRLSSLIAGSDGSRTHSRKYLFSFTNRKKHKHHNILGTTFCLVNHLLAILVFNETVPLFCFGKLNYIDLPGSVC